MQPDLDGVPTVADRIHGAVGPADRAPDTGTGPTGPTGPTARPAPARQPRVRPGSVPGGIRRLPGAAVVALALGLTTAVATGAPAGADSTGAGSGGGTVSVGAGSGGGAAGGGSSGSGGSGGSGGGSTGSGGGTPSPWSCTYTYLALNNEGGFAPGGPIPGAWYSVICVDVATAVQVTQTVWLTGSSPVAVPQVDPRALALEAENSIRLPRPSLGMNPSGTSVVGLDTWLWIDPAIWHDASVTATAGPVSATAVARPVSVRWTTGDGGEVVCQGPGISYVWWLPASAQGTSCAHGYLRTSAGQPTLDGDPDHGTYVVTATVDWAVSWTSTGVAGGGALPMLLTSDAALLRVVQVESVNTLPAGPALRMQPTGLGA